MIREVEIQIREVEIQVSPKENYEPLYNPPPWIRYIDLWGGRGRGGSHEATLYAVHRFTRPEYARIAIVRQILGDVRSSLWQDFKDRLEESQYPEDCYKITENMQAEDFLTGNTVRAFGIKADKGRTAKLKSLAGFNLVIIEEADELSEDDFDKLDLSLRTVKQDTQILVVRIFNPPGRRHWIWRDYNLTEAEEQGYWRATPKEGSKVLSIFSTYRDNIDNLEANMVERMLSFKERKKEYYYTVVEGMISEGQKGRIYSGWEPITNQQFIDIDARSIFALDFGWSVAPMALSELKLVKNNVYWREHAYKPMTLKEIAIIMCKIGITGKDLVIADAAERDAIIKLRTGWKLEELTDKEIELYPQLLKGFSVKKCFNGPGSIRTGIGKMQEMNVFVVEESENIWTEYREYKWALDKDKNPTDMPEDKFNHHMDGGRYVVAGRGRLF